jgi:hypothetical protein
VRVNLQQERDGRERAEASCERAQRRDDRQHVAVEVRAQREQVGEVDEHEQAEDQVDARAAH